jgi:hypothetical protein
MVLPFREFILIKSREPEKNFAVFCAFAREMLLAVTVLMEFPRKISRKYSTELMRRRFSRLLRRRFRLVCGVTSK